jgi:hypothetical protein
MHIGFCRGPNSNLRPIKSQIENDLAFLSWLAGERKNLASGLISQKVSA